MRVRILGIILFFLTIPLYYGLIADEFYIIYPLVTLLISEILLIIRNERLKAVILLLYSALCLWQPIFFYGSPLVLFATFSIHNPTFSIITASLFLLFTLLRIPMENWYLLLLLGLVNILVRLYIEQINALEEKTYDIYNEMRETELSLRHSLHDSKRTKEKDVHYALMEERNRISRDMHDGIGHLLSRALLQLGAVVAKNPAEKENIQPVIQTVDEAMVTLRKSLHNMKEETLDLQAAVGDILAKFTYCPVQLNYTIHSPFQLDAHYSLLAILQEALTNIEKHSNATQVHVRFLEMKERIFLLIADNGKGAQVGKYGIGLASMKERTESLGGQFNLSTEDGFAIQIIIPKENIHANPTH